MPVVANDNVAAAPFCIMPSNVGLPAMFTVRVAGTVALLFSDESIERAVAAGARNAIYGYAVSIQSQPGHAANAPAFSVTLLGVVAFKAQDY